MASQSAELSKSLKKGLPLVGGIILAMSIALFAAAGTLAWPTAWIFIVFYIVFFTTWVLWGLKNRPELIAERGQSLSQSGKRGKSWDYVIVRVNLLLSLVTYIVAGLDAVRFQWTGVPLGMRVFGGLITLLSFGLSFYVLASNPFASGVVRIQSERGHTVTSGGPYRFVRHPMYVGSIAADLGIPLFLGSYWALIPGFLMAALFTYRTWREDRTLQEELPGYKEYAQKVRYRLVPGVW